MFDGDIREKEEMRWFMTYSPKQKLTQTFARIRLMGFENNMNYDTLSD